MGGEERRKRAEGREGEWEGGGRKGRGGRKGGKRGIPVLLFTPSSPVTVYEHSV